MQEITVRYLLTDDEMKRLEKITEEYKKLGLDLTYDKQFESIMCCDSRYDIDSKFKFHEWKLRLREDLNR